MKRSLLTIVLSICLLGNTYSQIITWVDQSSNTFYVIPPTSGCNGLWAINSTLWPGGTGCTYTLMSCYDNTSWYWVGDTLFVSLCSVPCEIGATCSGGGFTMVKTGTPLYTSVDENKEGNNFMLLTGTIYGNGNKLIELDVAKLSEILFINAQGKIVRSRKGSGKIALPTEGLPAGLYFISINTDGKKQVEKITIE